MTRRNSVSLAASIKSRLSGSRIVRLFAAAAAWPTFAPEGPVIAAFQTRWRVARAAVRTKRQFDRIAPTVRSLDIMSVKYWPNSVKFVLKLLATKDPNRMTNALPIEGSSKAKRILFNVGQYLLCYLAGIIACVIFTPVEVVLIDASIWLFFVPLAPIGYFFFYFDLQPQYVFGSNISYWSVYVLGIALVSLGFASGVLVKGRFRAWRPLMIGFPIGFVGTLGVYYTAASSI